MEKLGLREWAKSDSFHLALSSGFFGFFAHAGFLRALVETGLIPAKIAGSSAGALVGACYASGMSVDQIEEELFALSRADFWDPAIGLGLLRGQKFHERLLSILPITKLEDCPIPLAISVFSARDRKTRIIDKGCLPTAIRASCAFPGLFHPVKIDGRMFLDGGIADGPGLAGVGGGRIMYHHLPSTRFWGRMSDRHSELPKLQGLKIVDPKTLPAVGPFRLDRGRIAHQAAYRHAIKELS